MRQHICETLLQLMYMWNTHTYECKHFRNTECVRQVVHESDCLPETECHPQECTQSIKNASSTLSVPTDAFNRIYLSSKIIPVITVNVCL